MICWRQHETKIINQKLPSKKFQVHAWCVRRRRRHRRQRRRRWQLQRWWRLHRHQPWQRRQRQRLENFSSPCNFFPKYSEWKKNLIKRHFSDLSQNVFFPRKEFLKYLKQKPFSENVKCCFSSMGRCCGVVLEVLWCELDVFCWHKHIYSCDRLDSNLEYYTSWELVEEQD